MTEMIDTNGYEAASGGPLLQPHNLEAEESVLGAMMVSEAAIDPVVSDARLKSEDFYRGRNGVIYDAIHELYSRNDPVDALTVTELLRSKGKLEEVGGRDAVTSLASSTPVPGNAGHYAQIVKQNSMLRRLLGAAQRIEQSVHAREGEPQDLVEQAEKLLFNVAREEQAGDFSAISDILDAETERLHKLASGDASMTGTPSGFRRLDEITGGFQPGNLIILAARPAMGKSTFVCNVAENVAWKAGLPVAFFSLEMSETELAHRFIASRARISSDRLRKGQVTKDWNKVLKACNELAEAPLWIDDSSDLSLLDLRAKCRRLHSSAGGLGVVIVDYIQLMRADDPRINRVEQVGQMSRGLKILARELQVPVIALSQLSRAPEQRTGKEKGVPMLSDLRESGCLTGESRVHLPDTGGWSTIADIVARREEGLPRVLALNEQTMKLEPAQVTNAFSTGTKPVFRLRTKLGRTIRATGNHRFRTLVGWRHLDELEVGDALALPRELTAGSGAEISEPEAALLGSLIGDGCTLPRHGVRNPIAAWMDGLGIFGLRSYEKHVPELMFTQSPGVIARFLRHLWSTDGSVLLAKRSGSPRIYYATSSERLARDVQSLLLRLGVNAFVRHGSSKGRCSWHVDISGRGDMTAFRRVVGTLGESKVRSGVSILGAFEAAGPANVTRDVIPRESWETIVKPAMAEAGITARQMQADIGTAYCGSTLYRSAMSRERAQRVATAVRPGALDTLASSDVYWDPVLSIEPDGVEEVYDLTVAEHANFVAEDIVVHNSLEQDADIVAFLFREDYYDEESDRPGEADLIMAKHRNGPIGKVPLAFQPQFPKFASLSTNDGYDGGDS